MTPNWSEDFELESRRHEAGTDAEQAEYDDAQALADDLADKGRAVLVGGNEHECEHPGAALSDDTELPATWHCPDCGINFVEPDTGKWVVTTIQIEATQDDDSSMCKESDEGDGDADEG